MSILECAKLRFRVFTPGGTFIPGGFQTIDMHHAFVRLHNKSLSAYGVAGAVPGDEERTMSERQGSCPHGTYVLLGKANNKHGREYIETINADCTK